jgi:hypothetical protein
MRPDRGPLGPSGLRSQVGWGGVGLGWPAGQGLGRGRPVGRVNLREKGKMNS